MVHREKEKKGGDEAEEERRREGGAAGVRSLMVFDCEGERERDEGGDGFSGGLERREERRGWAVVWWSCPVTPAGQGGGPACFGLAVVSGERRGCVWSVF